MDRFLKYLFELHGEIWKTRLENMSDNTNFSLGLTIFHFSSYVDNKFPFLLKTHPAITSPVYSKTLHSSNIRQKFHKVDIVAHEFNLLDIISFLAFDATIVTQISHQISLCHNPSTVHNGNFSVKIVSPLVEHLARAKQFDHRQFINMWNKIKKNWKNNKSLYDASKRKAAEEGEKNIHSWHGQQVDK